MAKIEGVNKVVATLQWLQRKQERLGHQSVIVGYNTHYAIYVHEDLTAFHPVGQAKYLEQPARRLAKVLAGIVKESVRRGLSITQGLFLAGLRLQRESQLLVPVDTGLLKNSAFTRVER